MPDLAIANFRGIAPDHLLAATDALVRAHFRKLRDILDRAEAEGPNAFGPCCYGDVMAQIDLINRLVHAMPALSGNGLREGR